MRFAHPGWLALLWLAPAVFALAAWAIRRRSRNLEAYARVPSRLALGRREACRWQGAALLAAAVGLTAFAAAGPQLGFHWRTAERRGVDVIVAVDCSRSMLARDVPPSRMDRARREVLDLLARLEGDRVGLVAFAGTAFLQCPLTLDYAGLHLFLQALGPDYLPVGGTALEAAVETALEGFDPESPADRAVVLITDGEETTGAVEAAAKRAARAGVRVYVLGVGTPEGAPVPLPEGGFVKDTTGRILLARLGEETLARLAESTGGRYARSVPGDEDWETLYDRGLRAELEARTLEGQRLQVWHDRFQWPLLLAVVALAAELWLPRGRRRTALVLLVCLLGAGGVFPEEARADRAASLVRQGLERYEAGDYAGAEESLLAAQVEAPAAPEIAFDLGNAQYRAGKFEDALGSYSAALREAGEELKAAALFNRGNAAFRLGRLEEAARDYRAALEMRPEDPDARLNLEYALRLLEEQRRRQEERSEEQEAQRGDQAPPQPGQGEERGAREDRARPEEGGERPPEGRPAPQPGEQAREEGAGGGAPEGEASLPEEGGTGDAEAAEGARDAQAPSPDERGEPLGAVQARGLLNRLEDRPGKALMPRYGKRRVEKDW
ncbi:MAG: hypothetical protein Kow0092_02240 [Deferrisomatales bacterium]